jgi:acyl-CoA thioesterase FadM
VKVVIEPSTHPLVKDPTQEVVFSYTPRPEDADADGFCSFGIFARLVDDATSLAISGANKDFQPNVSQSLDFKQFRKMEIGKRLLILTKIRQNGQVYCMVSFETFDEQLQLLNQGNHCKVFVEKTQKL